MKTLPVTKQIELEAALIAATEILELLIDPDKYQIPSPHLRLRTKFVVVRAREILNRCTSLADYPK